MLKEKITQLISSKYMRNILHENPDYMTSCGYFEVIMELSETLEEKRELLKELLNEWNSFRTDDKYTYKMDHKLYLEQHIEFCEIYLDAINNFDRSKNELLLIIKDYPYDNHVPLISRADAQIYIKENYQDHPQDTYFHLYLYEIRHDCLRTKFVYSLNRNGEIKSACFATPRFSMNFEDSLIFGYGDGIYIPMPYEPGDVVYIRDEDLYCLVLHSKERGFLNYFIFDEKGDVTFVDCNEGFYTGSIQLTYTDIVLKGEKTDKIFTGELAFINELSEMIRKNPEIGKSKYLCSRKYKPEMLLEILRSEYND